MPFAFLHIGAGKTGTSYLQAQLALNHEVLYHNNIYYPTWPRLLKRVEDGKVTSGNIQHLMPWLLPNHPSVISQGKVGEGPISNSKKWLNTIIQGADGRDILLSGEALQHARAANITQIAHAFENQGYNMRVIFYVRHAIDHALSDYREHVQRGFRDGYNRKELRSVEGWLTHHVVPYRATLRNYSLVLPDSKIIVRSYDEDKQYLWHRFLSCLGHASLKNIKAASDITINRSLTILETQFLEYAASVLSQKQMLAIGMKLISNPPLKVRGVEPESFMISKTTLDIFKANHIDTITEINERWLINHSTPLYVIPPNLNVSKIKARPRQILDLALHLLGDQQ
jgi:hypothetical protein